MATRDGKGVVAPELFLLQMQREVDGATVCSVSLVEGFGRAFELADDFLSMFEDAEPGFEIWFRNEHCLYQGGSCRESPWIPGDPMFMPVAPGRYVFDEKAIDPAMTWRLIGPV